MGEARHGASTVLAQYQLWFLPFVRSTERFQYYRKE
jgi:hypothetical protein